MSPAERDLVRLLVDVEKCIGIGQCELLEPEVFRLDDETGISAVIGDGLVPVERARLAVEKCPSGSISMRE